jgi:cytochrome c-type biogenesis protein CcmF
MSFELAILGTFITRSGVIDSVHSFGKSALGAFFMWFMGVTTLAFLVLLFKKYKELKEKNTYSLLSKEGLFFMANWLFFGIMFVVLFGTTLPMFSELFLGDKTSVGIPYYNKVSIPFFMGILVLSGLAPLMSYGSSSLNDILKKQWPAFVFMVVATAGFYALGYTKITPLVLFAFTSFSFFTILMQIWKLIKTSGLSFIVKHKRFTGALVTHLGVTIISFGVITSAFYKHQMEEVVLPGDKIKLAGYELKIGNLVVAKEVNYLTIYVPTKVYKNGKYLVTMKPEKRFYNNNENAFAEVAIRTTPLGDLYLILSSFQIPKSAYPVLDNFYLSSDRKIVIETYGLGIHVVYEPFILWIWIGCFIMVLGGFYGLFGRNKSE